MVDRRHRRHNHRHQQHHSHHHHSSSSSSRHHGRSSSSSMAVHLRLQQDEDFSFISPCVKYSLFFFNLFFWIVGTSLIALGTYSFLEEYNQTLIPKVQSLLDIFFRVSLALITIGVIVFCMSLFGCLGALRENLCLLKLYSLMLLLLFIGEIILSTLAFMFPQAFTHTIKESLSKDPIMKYREDANLQNVIDTVQERFKCCGVSDKGYKDWSQNMYFICNQSNPSPERCSVPYSCCRNSKNIDSGLINSMCGYNVQNISSVVEVNKYIYTRGCVEAFTEFFDRNLNIVASVCLVLAIVQLLVMFLARSLQGQIMAQRARWM